MTFENTPSWWVLLIALALLVLLVYWDFQSRTSRWRIWRLLAIVLILGSLLGLYARPFVESDGSKIKVALVTPSLTPVDTDSLKNRGYILIKDFDEYLALKSINDIEELAVLGDGLEVWELAQLAHKMKYLESKEELEGAISISPQEAVVHTASLINVSLVSTDTMRLSLSGTGIETKVRKLDSNTLKVSFEINPKVTGNLTYDLVGMRGKDTLFQEIVPMKVKERTSFNTLILTSSPSFEIRFLKNLLKAEGYGVAERLQVSKETFRESFSNLSSRSLTRLSKSLLEDFKVVLLDKDSYDAMSYSEKQHLNSALKKGKLGVVWMDNDSNAWIKTRSTPNEVIGFKTDKQTVELQKSITSFNFDQQISIQNQVVGHVHSFGLGKVLLPLLGSAYQLQLKGYSRLYNELWNALLQPVVGSEINTSPVEVMNFPRVDEPTTFTFRSQSEDQVFLDSTRLAIKEKWHQPGVFSAIGWPKARGWRTLRIGDKQHVFFSFGSADWQLQKANQKREQTASHAGTDVAINKITGVKVKRPFSKWIIFSVLVLAFGFLWLEGRLG